MYLAEEIGIDKFELARDPALKLSKAEIAIRCAEEDPERPIMMS